MVNLGMRTSTLNSHVAYTFANISTNSCFMHSRNRKRLHKTEVIAGNGGNEKQKVKLREILHGIMQGFT